MKRLGVASMAATFLVATMNATMVGVVHAANPIVTDRFIADPSAHVFNNRVYLYVTHDSGNGGYASAWNSKEWWAYSSTDLVNWTDHGQVFAVDRHSRPTGLFGWITGILDALWDALGWNSVFRWATDFAWAPAASARNGKYYLYLPVDALIEGQGRSRIGVAISNSPASGFRDARGEPLIQEGSIPNAGTEAIDPMVFVDDDGQAYLYYGGLGKLKVVRLQPDMINLLGSILDLSVPNYTEGPWVHKRNGIYYLSYSAGWPEQIAYATSSSPLGPFTYRGVVLGNVNINTNHHAIVQYNNQSYLFYHRFAMAGGGEERRSVQIDCLFYNPDGTIREVVQTTLGVVAGRCGSLPPVPPAGGPIRSFQSYNFRTSSIRHYRFEARIDANVSPIEDLQFIVVPGLADPAAVSFESVNFRGYYLRHRNYKVFLDPNDRSDLFKADATWYERAGLADRGWSSYESYNFPGQYMRHFHFMMILGTVSGPTQEADATFRAAASSP